MAGLFNVGAPIRSNMSVTQVVGVVSTGLVRSAVEIAAVDGVAIAPLGGSFESLWPLRAFESKTHSNIRVVRSVRRTARAFHEARFGFRHQLRHHAPLGG